MIGAFGQGFYTSTVPDPFHGPSELTVAIRTRNPLVGQFEDVESAIDDLGYRLRPEDRGRMTIAAATLVRNELLRMGYDALVIRDAGGDGVDVVVALRREIVKVVID